ncbi:MFS transporter [Candidatus Tachikawaea gelatinosa]|uniref:EmrY n=1 Tax=Candidatus Tachikawaea gelatinosa TaxID=1410383 RepID=A0A090AJ73_9ENTR|nr:MFS transporter [Candidatus Tachikawaea gelatinosa]BAP58488.1 EmrY [Candidatus Tachikawaea gelatinosa]
MNEFYTRLTKKQRFFVFFSCVLAIFMTAIEMTIISTALPTIISELGGFYYIGWIFSIYLLIQAVTTPIYGKLSDIFGRKKIFFIGIVLFLLGSLFCGITHTILGLIISRAFQGLGAGAIIPITSIIVSDIYSKKDSTHMQGYLSSVWAVAAVIGPFFGAWIIKYFHWSLIFWINIPIGIFSILIFMTYLPDWNIDSKYEVENFCSKIFLLIIMNASLIISLQIQQLKFWTLLFFLIFITSVYFFRKKENNSNIPLFPKYFWKNNILLISNLGNIIIGAIIIGISAYLPTWIEFVEKGTPLQAGIILSMMSVGWAIASFFSSYLILSTSYRLTAQIGSLLLTLGSIFLLLLKIKSSLVYIGIGTFIIGIGMGMTSTAFLMSVQNYMHKSMIGTCTSLIMFSRMLGSSFGIAMMGEIFNFNLEKRLPNLINPLNIVMSHQNKKNFSEKVLHHIVDQISFSLHSVFLITMIIASLSIFLTWAIPCNLKKNNNLIKEKKIQINN